MKARIVITDESGTMFEGEADLVKTTARRSQARAVKSTRSGGAWKLNFDLPMRTFMKSYAGSLSGPKKFVLVVAYLSKGQEGREVLLRDVEAKWNTMTSLLGGKFNRFYSGKARDDGWVETKKNGVYVLRPSWKRALS